jgi:hypothetical protein
MIFNLNGSPGSCWRGEEGGMTGGKERGSQAPAGGAFPGSTGQQGIPDRLARLCIAWLGLGAVLTAGLDGIG